MLYGAVIGYEGLITKNPVEVHLEPNESFYVFKDMDLTYFRTPNVGMSTDGSYTYFISSEREVELFIQGVKTAFTIIREITN